MKDLIVNNKYNNKNLNKFILDTFPNLKTNTLFKALRKKDILVNGKRVNSDVQIHTNDLIRIYISDELLEGTNCNINLVYEDDNILIINKPANIEVVGNNSITSILEKKYDFIKPCHRIDRNTLGIVLFAKNQDSLSILLAKFKNKEIEKHYITQVYGIPRNTSERLTAYLFKDTKKSLVYISDTFKTGYLKIITSYNLISSNKENNTSILDINLETGRTHQIRAHLAHIGLPIVGDGKYGINKINKQFNKKTQDLCAYKLKFNFITDSGILNYLNGNEYVIEYKF